MQLNIPKADQASLDLPIPANQRGCPRSVRMDLDNLMLAIEAIDLQGTEVMLHLVYQLHLEEIIPNRVAFWRIRNTNPLRRHYQRANLTWPEAKALVLIICAIARQLNTGLRQLLVICQHSDENKIDLLGLQQSKLYLDIYVDRFKSLYLSRMRSPSVLNDKEIGDLALHLLTQLLFCSGSAGEPRIWNALLDGAV